MIDPPPVRTISGMACLHMSIWLRRLTAIVRSHTSTVRSVTWVSREQEVGVGQRRVVVQDVQAPEAVDRRRHGRRHRRLVGEVDLERDGGAARCLDRLGRLLRPGDVEIEYRHRRAVGGEGSGRRASDASAPPVTMATFPSRRPMLRPSRGGVPAPAPLASPEPRVVSSAA